MGCKNNLKYLLSLLLSVALQSCFAQQKTINESTLFEKFKTDKTVLPDFSYAGYRNGETGIPKIDNYKVFDVTAFGAVANDTVSDKVAIQKAIAAANKNGSGIVFFPKGRFLINEDDDKDNSIISNSSKIIFRGSGSGQGGTELFMKNTLQPEDPKKMWTVPPIFIFTAKEKDVKIGNITKAVKVGEFQLSVNNTGTIKEGDWIVLSMLNNSAVLIDAELTPNKVSPEWTYIVNKGVDVKVYHQVVSVKNGIITLKTPVTYAIDPSYNWEVQLFANSAEVGIEDIAFVGNWKEKFVHHRSWQDDSGFTMFKMVRCTNSWISNCRFTDCSVAAIINQSANISVVNCRVTGNGGHEAVVSNGSTNVLMAKLVDEASQWHSFGSSHGAMNTVIWKCTYPSTTCFEAHASQPRNTLLDCMEGGLMQNRAGGALQNMPNHMQGLVLWNYKQTNAPVKEFEFWSSTSKWWKIPQPVVVGFSGGTTFKKEQLSYMESIGTFVTPHSLYEAQIELRLKKVPDWLKQLQ